ncbi:hypothetical protein [Sphingomonas fennica]|jgi:hypothetical protein|uniref:hypothetical protein n=1 Tax=Edaphosphingomonas fennica TaxID=114404 RepID=UPI001B87AE36|nr:hypothetical protein [Sphingomonas fennica]
MSNTESDPDIIAEDPRLDGLKDRHDAAHSVEEERARPAAKDRHLEDNGTLLGDREACGERKKNGEVHEWVHDREECA